MKKFVYVTFAENGRHQKAKGLLLDNKIKMLLLETGYKIELKKRYSRITAVENGVPCWATQQQKNIYFGGVVL